MPYWLETDQFADDQVWDALAGGNADRRDRLQAAYCRLKAKASHLLTDGYLTEDTALRYARGSRDLLERLTVSVLGRPPRLHRPGDDCECLGVDGWVDGYAFRIHAFLRRNPSRAEYRRNRTQRAELADPRLRARVHARDGGCCRYCRSGPLSPKAGRSRDRRKVLQLDHVDPDRPAGLGAANLVLACGRCNELKGRRTPAEADMVLLPPPSARQAAAWLAEPLTLFDADQDQNSHRISRGTDVEQNETSDQNSVRDSGLIPDTDGDPGDVSTGPVRLQNVGNGSDQGGFRTPEGLGLGRVGEPPDDAQPARPAQSPDVYTRRSRALGPEPPYAWPPGAVPVTPRPEDHDDDQP